MAPKKAPPRRNTDVIRCERCGEEYSTTYKRCPFCDERPGGRGYAPVGGKRVSGGGPNPLQVGGLIVSLILIITAAVIVFKYISPAIFGDKGSSSVSTSQSTPGSSQDGSSGDSSQVQAANSVTLSRTEVSLAAGEDYPLTATVDPEGVKVTWSSSDTSVATVDENGTVKKLLKNSPLKGKMALKSGSMTGVLCYAGYYPAEHPQYAVVLMTNKYRCSYDALKKTIETLFEGMFADEER